MPDCTPGAWETLESIGDSIFSARCLFSFLSLLSLYHLSSKWPIVIDLSQEKKGVYLYLQKKKSRTWIIYSLRYTKIRQARIPNFWYGVCGFTEKDSFATLSQLIGNKGYCLSKLLLHMHIKIHCKAFKIKKSRILSFFYENRPLGIDQWELRRELFITPFHLPINLFITKLIAFIGCLWLDTVIQERSHHCSED